MQEDAAWASPSPECPPSTFFAREGVAVARPDTKVEGGTEGRFGVSKVDLYVYSTLVGRDNRGRDEREKKQEPTITGETTYLSSYPAAY